MSQEKVQRYKQEKANRKEIIKKQKRREKLIKAASAVVALVVIGWIGFSVYDSITSAPAQGKNITVDMNSIEEYITGLEQ